MKTSFTPEEIKSFITHKIAELEGAYILMQNANTESIGIVNFFDKTIEMARMAGEIEGQLNFLKDFEKLVEL